MFSTFFGCSDVSRQSFIPASLSTFILLYSLLSLSFNLLPILSCHHVFIDCHCTLIVIFSTYCLFISFSIFSCYIAAFFSSLGFSSFMVRTLIALYLDRSIPPPPFRRFPAANNRILKTHVEQISFTRLNFVASAFIYYTGVLSL